MSTSGSIAIIDDGTEFSPSRPADSVGPKGFVEVEDRGRFESIDGSIFRGHRGAGSGSLCCQPYSYGEVCVILSGRVALVETEGNCLKFGAGERSSCRVSSPVHG